jgi:hypothetical protein
MGDLDARETMTRIPRMPASEEESMGGADTESSVVELDSRESSQVRDNFAWNNQVRDIAMGHSKSGVSTPESVSREPSLTLEDDAPATPTTRGLKSVFKQASKRDMIDANGYTVGMSMI